MKRRKVVQSQNANNDILSIYFLIAEKAGHFIARGYLDRVERFISKLDLASERGTRRDDLMKGLRIIGFERRVTIAFTVDHESV